jgi:hypothetical protein
MSFRQRQMARVCTTVAVIGLCCLSSLATAAEPVCERFLESKSAFAYPVSGRWRPTQGRLFSAFRSNAPFYWSFVAKQENIPSLLRSSAEIEGIGVGDFHIKNFDMVQDINGERKFQLIDLDDGGRTSLLLDFVRATVGIQLSPFQVPVRQLWEAYIAGLKGQKAELPEILKQAKDRSSQDFLDLQVRLLQKLTSNGRFKKTAELTSLEDAPPPIANLFTLNAPLFYQRLLPAKILDKGYYIKSGGGSQGTPRFWFLIEHAERRQEIIEFKTMAEPSVALFRPQLDPQARFLSLVKTYRTSMPFGLYESLNGVNAHFIVRTRIKSFLEIDPEDIQGPRDIEDGKQISIYMANRAGRWQAEQPGGHQLLTRLSTDESAVFAAFDQMVKNFISVMQNEHQRDINSSVRP